MLARETLAAANLNRMSAEDRFQQVKDYVIARLKRETKDAPRGTQARLSRALETSSAHISNMLSANPTRTPGEDFCRKAAAYWGLTYADLERLACGDPSPTPPPIVVAPDLDEIRRIMREEIEAALKAERERGSGLHQLGALPPKKKPTPRKG